MSKHSLIFIPDITGFTKFVNQTEVKHGQHIISELLEILIESNSLNMKVAEIEGDAVLFYSQESVPAVDAIVEQGKQMFINFHNHLQAYETQRICKCGACTSAHELSLKIIVHAGEIGFTTVQKRSKPYGAEIVTSHRLLKNSIDSPEYILFSNAYEDKFEVLNRLHLNFHSGGDDYHDMGRVSYSYAELTPFRELFDTPKPLPPPPKSRNPLIKNIAIEKLVEEVYATLIELDLRLLWNDGLDKLEYEKERVNRAGTRHTCLFPVGQAEFISVMASFEEGSLVYGEELLDPPFGRQLFLYYILTPKGDSTELRVEVHYFPKPFIGWIMAPFLKFKFAKQLNITLSALKSLSESYDHQPEISL